jgi:sulfhydrogenase subunit delta
MVVKLGFFSFTCCEGCMIVFVEVLNKKYFEWKDKIDLKYIRILRRVEELEAFDIAFVEGAISTPSEVRKLKKIRKNSRKLVAFGSGAINGWPSNLRNSFKGKKKKEIEPIIKKLKQIEEISPIKKFVKVDDEVPGCPVEEKDLIEKIEGYLKNA